jgi:hypothetical protein
LNDDKTLKREIASFEKIIDELNIKDVASIIITEDNSTSIKNNDIEIEVINIFEFLIKV